MVRASFLYTHNQEQNVQILYSKGNHSTGTVRASVLPPAGEKKEMNLQAALSAKISTNTLTNILFLHRMDSLIMS